MKHIILYGPGTCPTILVPDGVATTIKEKFLRGEAFEVSHGNTTLIVREKECWALKIEEFDKSGTPKRRLTDINTGDNRQ